MRSEINHILPSATRLPRGVLHKHTHDAASERTNGQIVERQPAEEIVGLTGRANGLAIVVVGKLGENVATIDVGRGVPRGAPCGQLHVGFELTRLLAVDAAVRSVVVAVDVSRIVGQPRESDEGALAQVTIGGTGGKVEIAKSELLQGVASEAVGVEVVFIDIGGHGRNAVARKEPTVAGSRGLGEVGSETVGDALTQGGVVQGFELT